MADQILEQVREAVEGQIDFEGQKFAELLGTALLATVGVCIPSTLDAPFTTLLKGLQAISFIVGFFLQDIKLALFIGLGGTALTFFAVVPPWPIFNKHPVKWLAVGGSDKNSVGSITMDGQVVG
jgi:signal peptidase complex subunit 1